MGDDNYEELIKKLKDLNIKHEQETQSILDKQRAERDCLVEKFGEDIKQTNKKKTRKTFDRFRDSNDKPLAINDRVTLLTSGLNGKRGDTVRVVKFGTKFVVIKFTNGRTTTRKSYNLRLR